MSDVTDLGDALFNIIQHCLLLVLMVMCAAHMVQAAFASDCDRCAMPLCAKLMLCPRVYV